MSDPRQPPASVDDAADAGYLIPAYAAPEPPAAAAEAPLLIGPHAGPSAPPAGYALPPYARATQSASPPSARGHAPVGRDGRPKTLGVVALCLAGAGILLSFTPLAGGFAVGFGLGALSSLLLLAAFVLSLVVLISRRQGGKGFGVGALLISILGGILSVVIGFIGLLLSFGSHPSSYDDPGSSSGQQWNDGHVDEGLPGIAAPGTDGAPDAGVHFAPPEPVALTTAAFGRENGDTWWYALVIDNPNADFVFDAFLEVRAIASDGSTIETSYEFATLLSGETVLVGSFFEAGDTEIAQVEVDLPLASEATTSPASEAGSFTVDGLSASTEGGITTVSGTVTGRFADDREHVALAVIARTPDGTIVGAAPAFVDEVPGDGTPASFEARMPADLPPDVTFQASAHR